MKTIRVAVTGGRDHEITELEEELFLAELAFARLSFPPGPAPMIGTPPPGSPHHVVVLHGACRGVDQRAAELAESWGYAVVPFEAPWERMTDLRRPQYTQGAYPDSPRQATAFPSAVKEAGPLRNWMMLKAADLLIAFPGGRGTADCVRQAGKLGVRVVRIGG